MSQDLWDAEATDYDEPADHGLHDPRVRQVWRELLLAALPAAPAQLADLGCGTATLTHLLAEAGYRVDAVDFSPAMVVQARAKTAEDDAVTVRLGDAADPPLARGQYDAVLCRHVLWALPSQVAVLRRWQSLLKPGGRVVLIEGNWSTGAGLTAEQTTALASTAGLDVEVTALTDPAYWGRQISDERYLVVASPRRSPSRPAEGGGAY